jgi:ribonuclease HI
MYFDGASKTDEKGRKKSGIGIVFITPEGNMILHSFTLSESCSNNVSEYTALIMGMELARDIKVHQLEVRGNSKLVINQMNGVYEVRKKIRYLTLSYSSERISTHLRIFQH